MLSVQDRLIWRLSSSDADLIEDLHSLRSARRLSETIRQGVRLVLSLRRGEVSVLIEMFPFIEDKLRPVSPVEPLLNSSLKPLSLSSPVIAPVEADNLEVKYTSESDNSAARNLLNQMAGLQGWGKVV